MPFQGDSKLQNKILNHIAEHPGEFYNLQRFANAYELVKMIDFSYSGMAAEILPRKRSVREQEPMIAVFRKGKEPKPISPADDQFPLQCNSAQEKGEPVDDVAIVRYLTKYSKYKDHYAPMLAVYDEKAFRTHVSNDDGQVLRNRIDHETYCKQQGTYTQSLLFKNVDDFRWLVVHLLRMIQELHEKLGVCHRDLLSANVVIPNAGIRHFKIIDFGDARSITPEGQLQDMYKIGEMFLMVRKHLMLMNPNDQWVKDIPTDWLEDLEMKRRFKNVEEVFEQVVWLQLGH